MRPIGSSALSSRPSITAFFPCYNDAPTIEQLVLTVGDVLATLTDDYEVIVVNDGSADQSADILAEAQLSCPWLRVVTHDENRGYGSALRSGFAAATKDLVFYTDGDAQYDPRELALLHAELTPGVDMVQGWKIERSDPLHRKLIGAIYNQFVRWLFGLEVRDVDCDFRLIRRAMLQRLPLLADSGSITVELVSRVEQAGFNVREVPVHHYPRLFGRSQFFSPGRVARTLLQLGSLWLQLRLSSSSEELGRSAAVATPSAR
ncbi:MAG TPA: glycosyltransferase family 2 protein [Chloroflexota bacterium]